jgi:hypothetical protein
MISRVDFPRAMEVALSSVVDIRMKEGNMKEFHLSTGSIGLLASTSQSKVPI